MAKPAKTTTRNKVWLTFIAILILSIMAGFMAYPQIPDSYPLSSFFNKFMPRLGLDLQGGTHLVYQADVSQIPSADRDSAMEGVRDVIERRVNAFGVSEPLVQTNSNYRLVVELAGVHDVNEAIKQIGETPLLEFKEVEETQATPLTDEEKLQAQKTNEEKYQLAKEVALKAKLGADFTELAREYSDDDATKENGGELSYYKRGILVPEYEEAIFDNLTVGDITEEPIKTDFGYHIIKKLDQRGEGEDQEVDSSHILIATISEENKNDATADWKNTGLSGKNLQHSAVEFDSNTGQPEVTLQFDDEGKDLFAEITKRNLQQQVAIFLDGQPISVPVVQNEITSGKAVISGNMDLTEAKLLAQRLNAGALPVPITLISQQTVGPMLGKISLQKSLLAGLIGLLAVAIFMLIYYRLMGLFAVLALFIYGIISFAIFEAWPITLSLSGIAGFILSIGMAVDANVLIFERTKEELINGKPLGTSVEEGFSRAWPSIRDSNISSIITCLILTWFGSSIIKGFAITLGIGILVSMFSAITVTRTFLRLSISKSLEKKLWLFGIRKNKEN